MVEFKRKQHSKVHRRHEVPPLADESMPDEISAAATSPVSIGVTYVRRFLLDPKTIIVIFVVLIASIAVFLTHHDISDASGDPVSNTAKPTFQTVLPEGKSIDDLGGWHRVNRPGGDPVFSFNDEINDTLITVSEQSLPASFASDTDNRVAELAKSYNATNKIKAGNLTAYIGTSAKGPQSVILTKEELLILIKSTNKIPEAAWIDYIKSLNPTGDNGPKF